MEQNNTIDIKLQERFDIPNQNHVCWAEWGIHSAVGVDSDAATARKIAIERICSQVQRQRSTVTVDLTTRKVLATQPDDREAVPHRLIPALRSDCGAA